MDSVVWWESLCGNETEYNAFWNSSLTIYTKTPDFTECFQKTILAWLPCVYLWLAFAFYVPFLCYKPTIVKGFRISVLNLFKVVSAIVLSIVAFSELLWYIKPSSSIPTHPVDIISPVVKIITFILAGVLTHVTYRKAIHSSGVLFMFWFFQFLFGIFVFRSTFLKPTLNFFKATTSISFAFETISFIACFFSDLLSPEEINKLHRVPTRQEFAASEKRKKYSAQKYQNHLYNNSSTASGEESNKIPQNNEKLCPKLTAPFFSVLIFWWFFGKVITGWRRTLTNADVWRIRTEDCSSTVFPLFEQNWNKARQECAKKRLRSLKKNPLIEGSKKSVKEHQVSLSIVLAKTFYPYMVAAGILQLFTHAVSFVNPITLNLLLNFVANKEAYTWHGYLLAVVMLCSSILGVLLMHHNFNFTYSIGMRIKTALTAAIYRKALTISPYARRTTTVGEIVNLMSVDTQKVSDSLPFFHYIWTSPLVFAAAITLLWQILGMSTLAGLIFMLIVLPLNSIIMAKLIREFQRIQMTLKDARLKLMNQILMGIKILKLYAWESYFTSKILEIRDRELKNLRKSQSVGAVTYILWFCSSFLVALLCFATYVLSSPDHVLDAKTTFVSLSLIMLMNFPLTILAPSIMLIVQAIVSVKRIEEFLLQEDVDETSVTHREDSHYAIDIRDGEFSWSDDDQKSTLTNINLQIDDGELVAIVGSVGCGKSSMLSALLGETRKREGSVNARGKLAYVAQQAWIQNLSLRNNILFDKPYDPYKYNQIIDACALRPDLGVLPAADETEIGERGINLSGGQKQRISLARAIYQDADVYLLDDTLSAVDAHVSKHIFDKVIGPDGLLKNKTRVLVTNALALLPKVDKIVVMGDGFIIEQGSFDELVAKNGNFAEFLRTYMVDLDEKDEDEETKQELLRLQRQISGGATSPDDEKVVSDGESSLTWRKRRKRMSSSEKSVKVEIKPIINDNIRLIQDETSEEGNVKLSVIMSYVRSAPIYYAIIMVISFFCFVASHALTNIWLSAWSNDPIVNGTQDRQLTNLRLGVYGGLGAAQTLSVIGMILTIIYGCIEASQSLHSRLLSNILKCPMSFFETVPLGRILNRFSKDIDVLDSNIPQFSQNFITTLCPLVSTIFIIAYTMPPFIGIVIPLLIIFVFLQRVYIACARQIKRIDSVRRSPVYAFFSETLSGTTSIRAFKQQARFIKHSDDLLDDSQKVWFEVFSSNRWIGIWSEFIADIMIFSTAIFAVLGKDTLDPSLVGLSLSFAFQLNMSIIMTVRSSCELETYIVAAERIKEYSEIENEAPWHIEGREVPKNWPSDGLLEFKNYSTRYRENLDLVLKDISVSINSMEKVGIVGRTGAGKSSMTLALFRLIEPANGDIVIDGLNLSQLGLHDVRKNLTVIPQDPVLFSGSLRFNLDPSNSFTDDDVWTALEQAHLKNFVLSLPDKIDHECGEDGANLSVGQRQLICLARALLRKSKILVLDEATAAIDLETDDLIQSTIRMQFKSSTVLTIAHRINTIMDYDRILVLEKGEVKEFASPKELLQNERSMFYFLARDAGLV